MSAPDNLVQRLRDFWRTSLNGKRAVMNKAADRIEELEAQLAECRNDFDALGKINNDMALHIAEQLQCDSELRVQLAEVSKDAARYHYLTQNSTYEIFEYLDPNDNLEIPILIYGENCFSFSKDFGIEKKEKINKIIDNQIEKEAKNV